jgi:hypothetical protein
MGENRGVFTYLESAIGGCPDCGTAYKWVEVRTEVINGITVKTRTYVCGLNHLTTDPVPGMPARAHGRGGRRDFTRAALPAPSP